MFSPIKLLLILKHDKRAVTVIEYALVASLVAVVIVGAVTKIGTSLPRTFNTVSSEM
jgi:pilus assembly protein Flp/PilA